MLYWLYNNIGGFFMTENIEEKQKKQDKILENIAKTVDKLDKYVDELGQLDENDKDHTIKAWYAQKRATHEIKHILADIDKYDGYDPKSVEPMDLNYMELGLDAETASFMKDYFA